MFARLERGWALTKASLNVLRLDTEILLLPVISAVVMILLVTGVFGTVVLGAVSTGISPSGEVLLVAGLLTYFIGYFVVIFFNAAVVAMATIRFDGGDPKLADGLRASKENWFLILKWAIVAATVGLLLRVLREQMQKNFGFLGAILGSVMELAWNGLVFFVVPLLVYRKLGPLDAIKESGALLRRAWGEGIAGEVAMAAIFGVLGLLGVVAVVLALISGSMLLFLGVLLAAVVYWLILAVVHSAAQGVLTAALYKYATTGQVPGGFDHSMVANAVS